MLSLGSATAQQGEPLVDVARRADAAMDVHKRRREHRTVGQNPQRVV